MKSLILKIKAVHKKLLTELKKINLRMLIAWDIVFNQKHGVCIYIDEKQLLDYIKDGKCNGDFNYAYFGMTKHISHEVFKQVGDRVDLLDVAMDKAIWEANLIEKRMNKKPE